MAEEKINTNIRYYLPSDPVYYQVLNLPINDLVKNDQILQFQIESINARLDSLSGRNTFNDLKPYVDPSDPGKVFVKPGNFVARVNIPADRDNGLRERINDGEHDSDSRGSVVAQPENSNYGINEVSAAGGIARTALVRVLQSDGIDQSVQIPSFLSEDYPGGDNGANKTPVYRLDLVFVEAYPAEDQDNGRPRLGVIQGGYFLDFPTTVLDERKSGERFLDSAELSGRSLLQQTQDIEEGSVIDEKKGGTAGQEDRLKYTTVVLPDDLKNYIFRPTDLVNDPNFSDSESDIPSVDELADWVSSQFENRGTFCLPICYVLTPFGFIAGSPISDSNLMDIRPFFRSAEMTFDERQAIAASYRPSIQNRYLTRKDPDYLNLRDTLVKGTGLSVPGNHEGRITSIEDSLPMATYAFDKSGRLLLLNNTYGGETSDYTFYGTSDTDLDIEVPVSVFEVDPLIDLSRIRGLVVRLDTYLKSSGNESSVRIITKVKKPSLDTYFEIGDQALTKVGRQTTLAFIPCDNSGSDLTTDFRFEIQGSPDASDPLQCKVYVVGVYY